MTLGYFDTAALTNERIERLRREAEERRIARSGREHADQGSPRRPKR